MIQKVKVINYNPEEIQEKIDALKQEIEEHNAPIKAYNRKVFRTSLVASWFLILAGFVLLVYDLFGNGPMILGIISGIIAVAGPIVFGELGRFEKEIREVDRESIPAMEFHLAAEGNVSHVFMCSDFDKNNNKNEVCWVVEDEEYGILLEGIVFKSVESSEVSEITLDVGKELLLYPKA